MRAKGYAESKVEDVKESQLRFKKPTTEEMRLAQLLDDKQQDDERESIILQVMETTSRLRDDVIIALHDCNYDPIRAIEVLMDHDDLAKEEWQECGIAKRKKKVMTATDDIPAENAPDEGFQNAGEIPQNNISNNQRSGNRRSRGEKGTADNRDNSKPRERRPNRGRGDDRRSRTVGERHPLSGSNNENASDWQPNETEGGGHMTNQKPYHRRNYEPGADEPSNDGFAPSGPRRGGRGGASARGRSWYGGRNGGHDGGRGGPVNGVGRGRYSERQSGGQSENANANSFTVGTWENSEFGKQGTSGGRGGVDDWDIDEWDGSLTKTQVFERSNAQEKVSYGAIGAKPGSMQPLHVDDAGNSGQSSAHSPNAGPIRVTLDNVMNVGTSRRQDEGPEHVVTKSPRRPDPQQQDKQKPPTPQRQEKAGGQASAQPQRSQQQKQQQVSEPPVVILDNRRHVVDPHGNSIGLRFGSGLDSIGLNVSGGTNGDKPPQQPVATVQPTAPANQAQRQAFSSSPYRQNEPPQASPTKQPSSQSSQSELGGPIPQQQPRGLPPQQLGVSSRPQSQPQQQAGGFQQQQQPNEQFNSGSFRPPSSGASKPPVGLDPSITQVRNSAQSPYQQQVKINGDQQPQQFGVQSQPLGRAPQQQPSATSASVPPLFHQSTGAPIYTGTSSAGSANAFSTSSTAASTKLSESMTKLSVQDVVKSPQRQQQQAPTQQQQQQPAQPSQQQVQPQTTQQPQNPVTSTAGFDQNMLKFAMPPPPPAYAMPPPAAGTMPYYFPQYPANQQNQNQQQAQQQGQQPQTSVSSSVGDYFNTPDVAALYQRTLLEQQHGGPQQGHGQQGGQAASPMIKPPNQPQDSRIAPEQLLGMATAHGQNQGAGNAQLPPHSSAAGMPPGGVPPAFLTPQLFYPLMQLFAANPTLMAPFLASQVPAPQPTADLKSQAQFLQAVGMSPFLHYTQQQQQQPASSQHLGDDLPGVGGQHQSQQQLVGHQGQGGVDNNSQQHQQHQQHVSQQQSIRPPPGFLMPVRQSSSGMNMPPSNSNDGNMSGFRAFQQHQAQQQADKGPSNAGGPPGLFGPGPAGPNQQAAFLAAAAAAAGGAQQRQGPQPGGVVKPQQSHMNPYWNPNS